MVARWGYPTVLRKQGPGPSHPLLGGGAAKRRGGFGNASPGATHPGLRPPLPRGDLMQGQPPVVARWGGGVVATQKARHTRRDESPRQAACRRVWPGARRLPEGPRMAASKSSGGGWSFFREKRRIFLPLTATTLPSGCSNFSVPARSNCSLRAFTTLAAGDIFLRKKLLRFFTGHSTRAMILPVQACFWHLASSFLIATFFSDGIWQ